MRTERSQTVPRPSSRPGTESELFAGETVERVVDLVRVYRRCQQAGNAAELEAKLGRIEGGKYLNGLPESVFQAAVRKLASNPKQIVRRDAEEQHDFFLPTIAGEVRMRVQCDSKEMVMKRSFVQKRKVAETVFFAGKNAVKITVAVENPMAPTETVATPTFVRIKQRQSFEYPRPAPTWKYDLSLSWSGRTKTEAETSRSRSEPPCREVEVELADDTYLSRHTEETVAKSLLMKANDFLLERPDHFRPISA